MLKVAFIGLGHWHVPMHVAAARRAGLEVLGGWDSDPSVSTAWAQANQRPVFGSLDSALAAGPELAVVTGTPLEMPARLKHVAESGVPVLVEKPVAIDADALRPTVDDLERAGAWVAVALPHRSGPLIGLDCGAPRHFAIRLVNGPPARYRSWSAAWVLDPAISGGGSLRNLGVHGIDLAVALLGADLRVTHAATRRWHGEAVEDHAIVHLEARGGATATVEAGYLHPDDAGSDFEARLIGHDCLAVDKGSEVHLSRRGQQLEILPAVPQSERYDAMMADIARRLTGGAPPPASLQDLLRAMRLIDDAYQMAAKA